MPGIVRDPERAPDAETEMAELEGYIKDLEEEMAEMRARLEQLSKDKADKKV